MSLKDILEASYQPNREATNTLEKAGYKLDPTLSTREHKVFIDEASGEPNIVFRGTNPKATKDIFSDVLIGLGLNKYDPRQQRSNALVEQVKKKYNKDPHLYGHSLGGKLAEEAGRSTSASVTTFNKATDPRDVFKTISEKQTDVRTENDPISIFSVLQRGKRKTLKGEKDLLKTHGLSSLKFF